MTGNETHGETEYLDRARKLRDTAAQVRDLRLQEILISSAESYERMAACLVEIGRHRSTRGFAAPELAVIFVVMIAVCTVAAMQLIAI